MKKNPRQHRAAALIISVLFALGTNAARCAIPASERAALLDFYTTTNGADWAAGDGWNGPPGTECTWLGITCDAGGTTVTRIDLALRNIKGSLPSTLNNLTNLAVFYVPVNYLTGEIPSLAGLANLTTFMVEDNQLTGSIPALTGLSKLTTFHVFKNQLTGSIPALVGLTNLSDFDVHGNQLTGPIPALTGLTDLQDFTAFDNQLTGTIPELTGLTKLSSFIANQNQLTGPIPALFGLTSLRDFEVSKNQLVGPIPALAGLTNLVYFTAGNNQLTGSIPLLTGVTSLNVFDVSNNRLSGSIPTLGGLSQLQIFRVSSNQLTGNVPAVPSPNNLAYLHATLCPNLLNHTPDPAWDAATGQNPWYVYCVALPANANFQGLWWVPGGAESGWGINFAHQGDQIFATWYTYDITGKAWWLSLLATRIPPTSNSYAGTIYVDSGPPFNNFVGSGAPSAVGNGTLTFADANNGRFDYVVNLVVQTKTIKRYDLGTGPQPTCTYTAATPNFAAAINYQDLWWVANGAESGWGVNFAHQGDSLFATWYTYDVDGTPLWLSTLLLRVGTSSNVYTGKLYRNSGPRFDFYDTTKVVAVEVGTATLTFTDGNTAKFDYVTNGGGSLPAVSQSKQITRFPFAANGGTACQ